MFYFGLRIFGIKKGHELSVGRRGGAWCLLGVTALEKGNDLFTLGEKLLLISREKREKPLFFLEGMISGLKKKTYTLSM